MRGGRGRRVAVGLRAAVAVVAAVGVAGCGDDGPADKADEKPAEAPATVPSTAPHESIVGSTVTTSTTAPPPTTVTVPVGLPDGLGIPGAGQLTLGSSSSLTNGMTVRGVPIEEVVAFVRRELAALGYAVAPDLTFAGPGAVGQATVAQVGDDVEVDLVLRGPPG